MHMLPVQLPASRLHTTSSSLHASRLGFVHERLAAVFLQRAMFAPTRRAVQVRALEAPHRRVCITDTFLSAYTTPVINSQHQVSSSSSRKSSYPAIPHPCPGLRGAGPGPAPFFRGAEDGAGGKKRSGPRRPRRACMRESASAFSSPVPSVSVGSGRLGRLGSAGNAGKPGRLANGSPSAASVLDPVGASLLRDPPLLPSVEVTPAVEWVE